MISSEGEHTFLLTTRTSTYAIDVVAGAVPALRGWGAAYTAAATPAPGEVPYGTYAGVSQGRLRLEGLAQEYAIHGTGDFRRPALRAVDADGFPVAGLSYRTHRISAGKPPLAGLPSLRLEPPGAADTLEIELADAASGLEVVLSYTIIEDYDAVARHVRIRNGGDRPVELERVMSASVDLAGINMGGRRVPPPRAAQTRPGGSRASATRYDVITLTGDWASERNVTRTPLGVGVFAAESTRGTSSHVANPFIALAELGATEHAGHVYAASLVYSGNFLAEIDASLGAAEPRLNIGINPQGFRWHLEPAAEFSTPEAVLVYSAEGLNGMSRRFHALWQDCLVPRHWAQRERPVLLNSWEAQYFDVSEHDFLELADSAAELGVELVVLDDGWFGSREDDTSSLGDWRENTAKLPNGLEGLSRAVHERGLGFGLWVEPEMVSPRSRLYEEHPDWCLEVPGGGRGADGPLGRTQLVLDLAQDAVQTWMIETFSDLFARAGLDYVKWDMNRYLAPSVSAALSPQRRGESAHRYVLGLYRVIGELTRRFPDILFESCAGGGGRFDPGMLAFMPQTWTSDNTDAVSRLYIQYGTSFVYPPVTMGAHVSAVPNHQVGRATPLSPRRAVAMSASFGFELDVRRRDGAERAEVARQIAFYKRYRRLLQFGRFTRLESPFEGNRASWMFTDHDLGEALVVVVRLEAGVGPEEAVRLRGLDPAGVYDVVAEEQPGTGDAGHTGAELESVGLPVRFPAGDYAAVVSCLRRR